MGLSENAVTAVLRHKERYLGYRLEEKGQRFEDERRRHEREVRKILSDLDTLDEASLLLLANNLYAFMWWTRKEWLVQYWLKGAGGLERLRHYLKELLYSSNNLSYRFDSFRKNVKGIGVAMVTEMLAYFNPREYGIWNKRVKEALIKLGINRVGQSIDVNRIGTNNLRGAEYEALVATFREIAKMLRDEKRLPNPDMLDVDYFLYYVLTLEEDLDGGEQEHHYDHDEVVNTILDIGKGLGFDVSSEVPLVTGARVDAVWLSKIGNLGELKYVFEVQIKGSVDSLILNLMKASHDPTVQKVVAVAYGEELEKIRKEAQPLKGLSDKLLYWNIKEVVKANELIQELMDIMQRLGLVRP